MTGKTLPREAVFVLIVDDDASRSRLTAEILQTHGFRVECVGDGTSALSFCARACPDLVLLDLTLPGMNGLATCAALRQLPAGNHLPIVMLIAQGDHESIRCALESGVADFVTKPVNAELLVHRLRFVLKANRALRHLSESQARLQDAQRIARLGNWEWHVRSNSLTWSEEIEHLFSPPASNTHRVLGTMLNAIYPFDRQRVSAGFRHCLTGRGRLDVEFRIVRNDQDLRFFHLQGELQRNPTGRPEKIIGVMQDISERRQAEDRLSLLKEAVESLPIGITISDEDGRILYANSAEAQMHGFTVTELMQSKARDLAPDRLERPLSPEHLARLKLWKRESVNRRKNGEEFPVQLFSIPVHNRQGEFLGLVTTCEDISDRKQSEAKIEQLAYFDTLTGLPNRWMFRDRLKQALALAQRDQRQMAIMYLDLDRFKFINDTMGHDFGDQLLIAVARRLEDAVRKADTVARLGGDEFVVLLPAIDDQMGASIAAKRLLDAFSHPFELQERAIFTTPSVGIALFPIDGIDSDTLLKHADAAMYHAKSFGGQTFRFFSHEINQRLVEKMALETQLRRALELNEFVLYYQPLFNVASGQIAGVEALVRWQHPEHGMVMPTQFIPLMEENGMILALGEWVLRTACRQVRLWREARFELRMGINISACQFRQAGFLELVDQLLHENNIEAGWIEFELTEGMIMDDAESSRALLLELKKRGIHLSIDDFGIGYSSLSYLKNFPLDRIKIDRSFMVEVAHNRDDAAIVEAIITMAANLNLKVVAEGVENRAQFDFVACRGCHETQGYLFSRPLSAETLTNLFSNGIVNSADARYTAL